MRGSYCCGCTGSASAFFWFGWYHDVVRVRWLECGSEGARGVHRRHALDIDNVPALRVLERLPVCWQWRGQVCHYRQIQRRAPGGLDARPLELRHAAAV